MTALALALAGSCGDAPSSATLAPDAPSETPPPERDAAPAPAEPGPERPPPPPPPPPPEPPLYDGAPVPGFVIYTREQSVVVALDGEAPRSAAGLWVQDDRVAPPRLTHALLLSRAYARRQGLPGCSCLAVANACEYDAVQVRRFEPETGALLEARSDPDCACVHEPDAHGFPPFVAEDGEAFEACEGGQDDGVASLIAGQLQYNGWDWNGACYGALSVYDATDATLALVDDPPPLSSAGMRTVACFDMGPAFVERPWPIGHGAYAPLDTCESYHESEIFMIRRGHLWAIRDDISHASGTRTALRRPARPDSCPGRNDACGDPAPFRARARLGVQRREFWIATDGGAALTAVGHDYALWPAGDAAPREFRLPDVDATADVIGVRTHADVGRLRALLLRHAGPDTATSQRAPETLAVDRCRELHGVTDDASRGPRAWGSDCVARMRIGHWRSAEASCLQGLAVATEAKTRGALLYNLGRISETQGAHTQAAARYRASLAARPGNRAVQRRLAALERASAAG